MGRLTGVLLHGAAPALLVLVVHAHAAAQVGGSVALVSDYVYRGVSLSRGAPAPQLTLVYDNPGGWYAAAFASRIRQYDAGSSTRYIGYAGYARRMASGRSWEVGASSSVVPGHAEVNFREVFAGLAADRVSARLTYAPNYLGQGMRALYAELNASHALRDKLNLFLHAGYFGSLSEGWNQPPMRRADARIGLGLGLENWEFQLAWSGAHQRRAASQGYATQSRNRLVLHVMRRF